ncbi:hypothetical protein EJB05_19367, partial [Eragrostis curvula]
MEVTAIPEIRMDESKSGSSSPSDNVSSLEKNGNVAVDDPPNYIVLFPDLLEKGWGWQRLLPYYSGPYPGPVSWSTFKGYLKDYFDKNKDEPAALYAHHKRDPVEQDLSADPLHLAASLCITKEAELILLLSKCNDFDTTGLVEFSNRIRQTALNLLLTEEPESAAAMVGIAKEALCMRCHLSNKQTLMDPDLYVQYMLCQNIREATATVLTMLEDDFCFETAVDCIPSAESEKPMGIATASELKCQESDPKKNYIMDIDHCEKDNNLKGKKRKFKNGKRLNKNSNNATGKELKEKKLRRKKRRLHKQKREMLKSSLALPSTTRILKRSLCKHLNLVYQKLVERKNFSS